MDRRTIIEWAPFTIKEQVTERTLLEASGTLQEDFLKNQAGFIRRELVKKSDREYIDVVYWKSREDADKAITNAETSPACFTYFQLMVAADHNDPGAGVSYFEVIDEYQTARA